MAPFQGVVTGSIPVGCIIIYDPCHWLVEITLQHRTYSENQFGTNVERSIIYVYAKTYHMLRVYGGRAGLMFAF